MKSRWLLVEVALLLAIVLVGYVQAGQLLWRRLSDWF
jgi:hypothetical protein